MLVEKDDGLVVFLGKPRVDALRFGLHFVHVVFVAFYEGSARRSQFDEGESSLIVGIFLEESLEAAESFDDAFGVIDAVDADSEKFRLDVVPAQQLLFGGRLRSIFGPWFGHGNADGKWFYQSQV